MAVTIIAVTTMLLLFFSTYILLQLKFKEEIELILSDWIKIILPIVSAAVVAIFAFLGVDRLKNYDERQNNIERRLRDELIERIDLYKTAAEPIFKATADQKLGEFKESLSLYEGSIERIETSIKKYDDFLNSITNMEAIECIGSILDAHNYVVNLQEDSNKSQQRWKMLFELVERIKEKEINGDADDYHNLAAELAIQNYYSFAAAVVKTGNEIFPGNIDLISDAVLYASKAGQNEDVIVYREKLSHYSHETWNWRAFTFMIDAINSEPASAENKEKALQLVKEYKKVLPNDERAFRAEYETHKKYGELQLAKKALITAERSLAMTAQCSLTLSEIYRQEGLYDLAIASATKAIISQAESQPSSNTGAAYAFRAFARDAKVLSTIMQESKTEDSLSEIRAAITDYKIANRFGYRHNVENRIRVLENYLPPEEEPISFKDRIDEIEKKVMFIMAVIRNLVDPNDNNN